MPIAPALNAPPRFPSLQRGQPAILLAPMQGVTDAPMRRLLHELGGFTFCVAEFLRVSEHVLPARVFHAHVPELRHLWDAAAPSLPVSVQLLGGDPERLALTAQVAVDAGAQAIDLNFGCPAPTVNRHDGGATLLQYPRRIRDIVAAVRQALPGEIPVSAKLRLGWDSLEPIHENADMAAQGGASWITIHARTRIQGYQPPAYWGLIGEVNRRLPLPIVANGDIWTIEDLRRCREETGCEHFMLGRSALANPWLPQRVAVELGIASADESKSAIRGEDGRLIDWLPLLQRFAALSLRSSAETPGRSANSRYTAGRIKQWLRIADAQPPRGWLELIKSARTTEEVLDLLVEAASRQTPLAGRGDPVAA